MSETKKINSQNGKKLLSSIFKPEKENNIVSPILEDSSKIPSLLLFLKDKEKTILEKTEIIFTLFQLFKANNLLLSLFMRNNIVKKINFFEPLIDLYLIKDEYIKEYKELIENILRMILSNITLTKAPIEYLYKKLSYYYDNHETEEKERLNENQILKYLHLLKLFYTIGENDKNILDKNQFFSQSNTNTENIKDIKNYFYFNGKNSCVSLELNKNSINPNTNYPTLQYGMSFVTWIYIDDKLLKKYQENNRNLEISLITINISGEQIKFILKDIHTLKVSVSDSDTKNIQTNLLKANDWNNICISILEKKYSKLPLKIFINSAGHSSVIDIPKDLQVSSRINSIKLFENFIGKVSSFMIISKVTEQKEANYYSNIKKYGFYKNKILLDFILSNEKSYFAECKNYKYLEKCKSNKAISFYDFHLNKQNIKNMIAIFCPFAYNKFDNKVDDIFGHFVGVLGENDGVNNYIKNSKRIIKLGGINNLLPIIELMYSTISKSKKNKFNLVDGSILTQSTFYEFLNLIKIIVIGYTDNLINANKTSFFSSLSLFIEKFPPHLFTPKILQILLDIGKETFQNLDKWNSKENYINLILLNEKIISKYNAENQILLWKNIYSFFTSDATQIKEFFDIKKICLLLRLFDEERYNKYCCKNHYEIFNKSEDDYNIMKPHMDIRLKELFEIIQLYVDELCNEEQTISLFQLLSLDLSPCLQKKIIQVYINYFNNSKIEVNKKLKSFDSLLKNNFIDLLEYAFSISLIDVRLIILTLFKIILDNEELKNRFHKYLGVEDDGMNDFYIFITENLLPEQLFIKIDDKKDKINLKEDNLDLDNILINNLGENENNQKLVPLTNYFNKNAYKKEISKIWDFLNEWIVSKTPVSSKSDKSKDFISVNDFVLDFCISFVSRSPFNFIDSFISKIISYFKDDSNTIKEILDNNINLYHWVIETIFCFHNSEIDNSIYQKEDILSIQQNTLNLFEVLFNHRRDHNDINKRIEYILKYSNHLRKINGSSNKKKISEITRITRLLLQKIIDASTFNMNYKAKHFFDFILFHKNYNKLIGLKRLKTNNNINRLSLNNFVKPSSTLELTKFDPKKNRLSLVNDNIPPEILEQKIKEKSNDDFNNNNQNSNLMRSSLKIDESNKINNNNSPFNKSEIIPSYIFNGLHCKDFDEKSEDLEKEGEKGKNLQKIWEDFNLFDSVIDYFSSNLWGIENLRKKVKVEIDNNVENLSKKLLKEYGDNKSHRNKLKSDILRCLNMKDINEPIKPENIKMNFLNINIILLSIAIEITQDCDEIAFLERKFQQFMIFCVMVSININTNDINYDLIQDLLYDALGFAFIFLKKRDIKSYNQFVEHLIFPLFDDGAKKLKYFCAKKNTYKNSAISRLFELKEKKKEDKEDFDDITDNDFIKNAKLRMTLNVYDSDNKKEVIANNNKYKDDSNLKKNNTKIVFKGDSKLIIKHLFDDTLNKIKNEKKDIKQNNFSNYYNSLNKSLPFTENSGEKERINKIIKKMLNLYENQIKNYANNKYLEEQKRKRYYRKNKAKLFSWMGFWSNKYLFYEHPGLLKLKVKNHFSKEMFRPLLVPVLDIDYYTPPFKKFDKNKLFNNDDYYYKINLDIDDILQDDENNQNNINSNNIINVKYEDNNCQISRNKYGFNFLESLYKYSYNDLWEIYKSHSHQKINFEKIIILNKEPYNSLIMTKIMSKNIEDIQRENIYYCCIVKLTHHIKGYISTEKNGIRFIFASDSDIKEEELKNVTNYDKEMECCFGAIFKNKKNDKDKVVISIEYANIKYIFQRQYFYDETALEIFTKQNKNYFFNFQTDKDLAQFKNDIIHHGTFSEIKADNYKGKKIIGYQQISSKSKKKALNITNQMEKWQTYSISTMEYLMWLNIYAGRSFNDLTQYPVFPWLITNYSEESQELSIKKDLRHLNIPMGMMDLTEKSQSRKDNFIETYDSIKNDLIEMYPDFNYQDYLKKGDEYLDNYRKKAKKDKDNDVEEATIEYNQIPYFFGSHYSNPTYISHYLSRTFPYSYVSIEIQGEKFDDPDRIFTSMEKTFKSTITLKDDVRELIPEFYMLPELLLNINNLNLSQNKSNTDNNIEIINDVKLPLWCKNNAIDFVVTFRRYLENNVVNSNLNKWIDLIFGVNQRGEKAEESHNIFQSYSYQNNVKINSIKDIDARNALMRQFEMGVTPFQIFDSESKNRININSITLDQSKNLVIKTIYSNKFNLLKNKHYENYKYSNDVVYEKANIKLSSLKIIKITNIDSERIKIFTNQNRYYVMKLLEEETNNNTIKVEESNVYKYSNDSVKYACSYMISNIETPFLVYNDNQSVIKGGFWDGRLEINHLSTENKNEKIVQSQTIFYPDYSPITVMAMTRNEKMLLFGTKDGILISSKINKEKSYEYIKSYYIFDDEITSISINEKLNIFAVSSRDGFINLYIVPSFKLVRTISLNKNKKDELDELFYADHIFLSNSPLACLTIYNNSKRLFKSYTINGQFICKINESDESSKIKCPIIYTNNSFQDILLYGTNDGYIKMRKFPEMTIVNSIPVFKGKEINSICISPDKKCCYVWSLNNVIAVIKDSDLNKNI